MFTNVDRTPSSNVMPLQARALVWVGLAVLIGLAFSNSFESGFVLDNQFIIEEDTRLREFSWKNLGLIFTEDYWYPKGVGGLYRPMTTLTFLVEYSIFGFEDNPTHYHWTNIILHLMNAGLVYCLMNRLSIRFWISAAAACLFAVHPITTESVTNLVGRSDLLATLSVLSGLLLYIESTKAPANRRWIWLCGMTATTLLGVFSKESAIVIAGLVPLYDLAIRFRKDPAHRENVFSWFGAQFVRAYVIFVPIIIGLFVLRYFFLYEHGPSTKAWGDNPIRATDFLSGRLTAMKVIVYYLGLLAFPLRLSCDYTLNAIPNSSWRMTSIEDVKAIASVVFLLLLVGIAWKRYQKGGRIETFFVAWVFIAMLPTSNLLFLIDSNMAERFMYLPLIGFVGLVAMMLDAWFDRLPWNAVMVLMAALIGLLGFRTYDRNRDWQSNLTLWSSAARVCPESFRVQRSLAWAIYQTDSTHPDFDTIIPHAQRAATIARMLPTEQGDEKSHLFLGMFYGLRAEPMVTRNAYGEAVLNEEARQLFELSVEELAYAAKIGEMQSVIQKDELVELGWDEIEIGPIGPRQVYENLWVSYSRLGRHAEAADVLRKIQVLNPLSSIVYHSLPDELALLQRYRDAGRVLMQAMLLGLESDLAWGQLAFVYDKINKHDIPPIVQVGQQTKWNSNNPLVREDMNYAFVDLIEHFLRKRNFNAAEELREASKSFDCDRQPIEQLFIQFGAPKPNRGAD